jgi:hypothetical protein
MSRKGIRLDPSPPKPDDDEPAGADVLPGRYTARVVYGVHRDSTLIEVRFDPRLEAARADMEARLDLYTRWEQLAAVAMEARVRLRKAGETIELVGKLLAERDDEAAKNLKTRGTALSDTVKTLTERLSGKEVQGIRSDPATVMARLFDARSYIVSGFNAPDPSAGIALGTARSSLETAVTEVNAFFSDAWAAYRLAVDAAGVSLFQEMEPLAIPEE